VKGADIADGSVRVGQLMRELPRDAEAAAAFRERVLGDPLYVGNLVTDDARATAILVLFDPLSDQELLSLGVEDRIRAVVDSLQGPETVAVTGIQTLKVSGARLMEQDLRRFVPYSLLLVVVVLVWEFRTVRGVLLPLATVVTGVIWTIGAMVLTGRPINMGTLILPPLLMAIGIAYAIHVIGRYYQEIEPGRSRMEVVTSTVQHVRLPATFAWLTTVLADGTLSLSPIPAIRDFGVYSVLGITNIFVLSIVLIPAALVLMPEPKRTPREAAHLRRLVFLLERLAEYAVRRRRGILIASAIACVVALIGASRIELETDYLSFFDESSQVRRENAAIAERLGGAQPIYVVVDGGGERALRRRELLAGIADLQRFIDGQPGVDAVLSVVDSVGLVRRALNPDAPPGLPTDQMELDQLFLFLDPDELRPVVTSDWSRANLIVRTRLSGSQEMSELVQRIEQYGREHFPGNVTVRATGSIVLLNRSADALAEGQTSSLLQVLVVLFVLMSSLFLSFRTGALTLVPNVVPIVFLFGAMGYLGIDLNISTSMIAVIAIGIAVDDTIHYFNDFNQQIRRTGDQTRAIVEVVRSVGQPIVFTAGALSAGFLILCLSNFQPIQQFGYLASFTMAMGLVTELLITPGLVTSTTVVTLWDLMHVRLGPQPQHEIPLFRGLRAIEARIVVVMGRLQRALPGDSLARRGELKPELYVLLNGRAEVLGEGGRHIRYHGRGEVIGEMGLVRHRPRSADVAVVEPSEYLVLDEGFLIRLQRRHPRIAAKVFLNLTRILSDRLEATTDELVVISRRIG
jgi:predicted RND superfamily exporter protein